MKFGMIDNSFYTSDYQYSPQNNNNNVQDMAYKVMQWLRYILFNNFFPATKLVIHILPLFVFSFDIYVTHLCFL